MTWFLQPEKLYDLKDVGKRIRKIRGEYTLEELGFLADRTSKSAVYNWENGKSLPNKERLKILSVLGRTTVQWILYGDFPDYIRTLFSTDSNLYSVIKDGYLKLGHKEILELYEVASNDTRQIIIEKTIEHAEQNNWSYSDITDVADYFLVIADRELKRSHYAVNLPPEIKKLFLDIEQKKLTDEELDSKLAIIREYFKS